MRSADRSLGGVTAVINSMRGNGGLQSVGGSQADLLQGFDELQSVLTTMEHRAGRRVVKKSLRAGLTVIVKSIRKKVPPNKDGSQRTEIKRAIGRSMKTDRTGQVQAKAGVHVGDAKRNHDNWYAHLLAMGTAVRTRKRVGGYFQGMNVKSKSTGRIVAEDFVIHGFDAVAGVVQATIANKAKEALNQEVLSGRA